jgi:hypothetical protein
MDLAVESDIYEPYINDENNYSDYLPPSSKFKNGLRCPCGTRKDHIFNNKQSFAGHIKTKTHMKWLAELNTNKMNYFIECEKLKDTVNNQKIIIARLEKEIIIKSKTIDLLTQQLIKEETKNTVENLLIFD